MLDIGIQLRRGELRSTMNDFFNCPDTFRWDAKRSTEIDIGSSPFPIAIDLQQEIDLFNGRWRKSQKNSVWRCRVHVNHSKITSFNLPFVLKAYVHPRARALREVKILQSLRHLHVCAYVSHFHSEKGTGILIYPSACFDLSESMQNISDSLQKHGRNFVGGDRCSLTDLNFTEQDTAKLDIVNTALTISGQMPHQTKDPYHSRIFQLDLEWQVLLLSTYPACLCRALEYVHDKGILHRDIKPENILVEWNGSIVLADFGCSVFTFAYTSPDGQQGAKRYAAPEVFQQGIMYTECSDIFSLGAVLSELETLIQGHSLDEYQKMRLRYQQASPRKSQRRFSDTIGECQDWLQALQQDQNAARLTEICRMLSSCPGDRPPSRNLAQQFDYGLELKCMDCQERDPT